jgi:hypothetical protein
MCRRLCFLIAFILLIGLSVGAALGAPTSITVVNYSFEEPNEGKIQGWDRDKGAKHVGGAGTPAEVPGWSSDTATTDSGVEAGYTPTQGAYTGFLMGVDPSVFNLTDFVIGQHDVFELNVDARLTSGVVPPTQSFKISLYYDNNGTRHTVASKVVDITSETMTASSLTFTADPCSACYDHEIGIEFDNVTPKPASGGNWTGFDNVRLDITSNLYRAMKPYPAHKIIYDDTSATLRWTPGTDLPSSPSPTYKVYLHQDKAKVDSNDPAAYKGTTLPDVNNLAVGGLVPGQTYYWRIDSVSGSTTYRGSTWKFSIKPLIAENPDPSIGTHYVPVDPCLTWTAGSGAVKGHVVIFGDSFNEVNNAPLGTTGTPPPYRKYITDVNDTNCTPSETGHPVLDVNTAYYWRVDEVKSTSPQTIFKGTIWNFTTVPIVGLGSITHEMWYNITGGNIADLTGSANYPNNPSYTDFLKSFDAPRDPCDNYGTRIHGWLYPEITGDYTFWLGADDTGELWLNNQLLVSMGSSGGWYPYHQFDNATNQKSTPIHLEKGHLYYIMALQKESTGQDWLSVAWSRDPCNATAQIIPGTSLLPYNMYALVWSHDPRPANGATDVEDMTPTLSWTRGDKAVQHDVYFSDKFDDVNKANSLDTPGPTNVYRGRQDPCTYDITTELKWNQTYYWRIDEVNNNDPCVWPGAVWSFTIRDFNVVDNFESYNNTSKIQNTWIKGGGGTVGYPDPNYAERSIIHAGAQSMPFDYNNVNSPYDSNATRTFNPSQNWATVTFGPYTYHPKSLTLWFRGYPERIGSFSYTGTANPYAATIYACGADIGDVVDFRRTGTYHDECHFGYKEATAATSIYNPGSTSTFTGVKIIAKVESIGNAGNSTGKAGVMIRDSLDANSVSGFMCVRRTGANTYGVLFEYRSTAKGGATTQTDVNSPTGTVDAGITLPCWVALTLATPSANRNLRAFYSKNGTTWYQLGTVQQYPSGTMTLPRTPGVYMGLAATPQSDTATRIAKFSGVSITAGAGLVNWKSRDISSIKSNASVPTPLYVTLQDSGSNTAKVTHSYPYIVLQNTWQAWDIALSDFAGVDLTNVKKITIGTGNGSSSSGTGTLYFDDIRVYIPRCVANAVVPDFTGSDCLVDNQDLRILTDNWLISDYQVTPATSWDPNNDANLVARYKFEGNYNDNKGTNHGDPCNTSVTTVNDAIRGGKVASFDGVNSYIALKQMDMNDFTLSAWIKTSTPGARAGTQAYQGSGLIWSDVAGNSNDFILAVLGTKLAAATGPGTNDLTSIGDVVTGQWVHVAMVRTRSSGKVELYINGMLDRTSLSGSTGSLTANPRIIIGANTLDGYYYKGLVDDVWIYSRALTAAEVARLAGKATAYNVPVSALVTNTAVNLYNDVRIDIRDYAILASKWLETLLWAP